MAKADFKNAAAKLLAQHAAKINAEAEQPTSMPASTTIPVREARLETTVPVAAKASVNWYVALGLPVLGCAITVLLLPETIVGVAGNAVVGMLTGGGLAWIFYK